MDIVELEIVEECEIPKVQLEVTPIATPCRRRPARRRLVRLPLLPFQLVQNGDARPASIKLSAADQLRWRPDTVIDQIRLCREATEFQHRALQQLNAAHDNCGLACSAKTTGSGVAELL